MSELIDGDVVHQSGTTDWIRLPQDMLTLFEVLTKSNDPLHTNPAWVRQHTRFSTTIAPGFLTLSLLPYFLGQLGLTPPGHHALNYGFDRIRWVAPVPVDSEIRARFVPAASTPGKGGHGRIVHYDVTIDIKGHERPAMVARWLGAVLPDVKA